MKLVEIASTWQQLVSQYFNDCAVRAGNFKSPQSRTTLVLMSPQDFLLMSLKDGVEQRLKDEYTEHLKQGGRFDDIPFLQMINNGDGTASIIGHEGRHRMYAFIQMHVPIVPVRILCSEHGKGDPIRWGVVNSDKWTMVKVFPNVLISEDKKHRMTMPQSVIYPTH